MELSTARMLIRGSILCKYLVIFPMGLNFLSIADVNDDFLVIRHEVLQANHIFTNDGGFGGMPACHLILVLLISWAIVWAFLLRGVSSAGKSAYFTALFPYFVLFVLMGRAVFLPNAWSGISAVINPNLSRLWTADVE